MAFDLEGARKAGYSDAEIAAHLAQSAGFDMAGAKKAGYSDGEVIAHLIDKPLRTGAAAVPTVQEVATGRYTPPAAAAATAEPGIVDKLIGAGEAALTVGTGATGGALGMVGGALGGLAGSVVAGDFGSPEAARRVEESAAQGMQALTYAPRTESGRDQVEVVGRVAQNLIPLAGLTGEMAALARAQAPAIRAVNDAGAAGLDKARAAAQQAGQRIAEAVQRGEPAPTPGTLGSVGAAAVDAATQRRAMAAELPVPVQLTKGQATRAQEQLRFETETAKDPRVGAQLRDFAAEQNARLSQNFDAFVDQTGAQATDLIGTGRAVGEAIAKKAARDKVEIRVAYRNAEKAGELASPVQLEGVAAWLNENVSAEGTTPVIGAARRELVRLGGADALPDGTLTPRDMTLANAEQFRKFVVQHTDQNPTNIRAASLIKQAVDQSTEGAGGELYSQARALRRRYAQQYEDRALIADLISNRKGTADRRVALEDVFRRSVLQGSREDVGYLRRVLQTGGEEGAQAWREIQGATVRHIRDQALGNVATDIRGNPIVSASKLNSAIKALDADGKLDFIFGKHGAQQMRDLGELSKVIYTAPPGTVNTSNTASVLLAALGEAGAWGGATGLPIPVLTGLKQLSVYVKDRRIQRRIQDALNQAQAQAAKAPRRAPETLH